MKLGAMSNSGKARAFTILALVAAALAVALVASPAWAADFTVTKTDDANDGTCDADCSLREAITAANAAAGRDTVNVPAGTYTLSIEGAGEQANATGDLDITEEVDIVGAGARTTKVDANEIDRVFHEVTSGAAPTVISGLTITRGWGHGGGGGDPKGGGVASADKLTLREVAVDGNRALFGGGVYSTGEMLIQRSTVRNNFGIDNGGGVFNSGIRMTIDNSTIAKNNANGDGGGFYENIATRSTIKNSTFADNTAGYSGSDTGVGGGLASLAGATFKNTIVARNTDDAASNADNCQVNDSAGTVSEGYNLEDANSCEFDQATDDIAAPDLGTLANNGGPTDTIALLVGSPAIDTGSADVAQDQRGVTRPKDGDGNGSSIDDRGAFELQAASPSPQCSDKADNDTDGQTDFPNDPGCDSATDDTESPDPPAAKNDLYDVLEDATLTVSPPGVLSNDTGGTGPLSVAAPRPTSGPSNGTLTLDANGSFVYKPNSNFAGTDSFTYKATDGSTQSNTATVTINVNAVADDCTIRGTEGNDVLLGTPGGDVICALGGNDEADGGGGNDIVRGGTGIDDLSGGLGADKLYGEGGSDTLDASDGVKKNDLADGGTGVDTCSADKGDKKVSCP